MTYVDFVYNPYPNVLLRRALEQGLTVVDGLMMLRSQLLSQFYRLTGQLLPPQGCELLDKVIAEKKACGAVLKKQEPRQKSKRGESCQGTGPEQTCREIC